MCRKCSKYQVRTGKTRVKMEKVWGRYDDAWSKYSEAYYANRYAQTVCNS